MAWGERDIASAPPTTTTSALPSMMLWAADNADAVTLVDRHWLLIAALWRRYGYSSERFAGVANDHRHLLRAIETADADAAAVIMGAHVTKAKQELLGRMASDLPVRRPEELTA